MEGYTTIINLTVVAVLLVILVASRRWRGDQAALSRRPHAAAIALPRPQFRSGSQQCADSRLGMLGLP
jgi:hypothetical protein